MTSCPCNVLQNERGGPRTEYDVLMQKRFDHQNPSINPENRQNGGSQVRERMQVKSDKLQGSDRYLMAAIIKGSEIQSASDPPPRFAKQICEGAECNKYFYQRTPYDQLQIDAYCCEERSYRAS